MKSQIASINNDLILIPKQANNAADSELLSWFKSLETKLFNILTIVLTNCD